MCVCGVGKRGIASVHAVLALVHYYNAFSWSQWKLADGGRLVSLCFYFVFVCLFRTIDELLQ